MGTTAGSLFVRDGKHLVPTDAARGPWRRDALHGGAVAALLATGITMPGRTPVRTVFDLLGPVPWAPLRLESTDPEGGERVRRQAVVLYADDVPVARALSLGVRQAAVELPPAYRPPPNPFTVVEPPALDRARPQIGDGIGWPGFDSAAVSVRRLRPPHVPVGQAGFYVNLLVPVVEGEPTPPLARAAAAADYASAALGTTLPFEDWSFMNAELTVHLARTPLDSWIGLLGTAVLGPDGGGVSHAALFDPAGRLGQAGQALVVEQRRRAVSTSGRTDVRMQ